MQEEVKSEVKSTVREELSKMDKPKLLLTFDFKPKVKRIIEVKIDKYCNCCGNEECSDDFDNYEYDCEPINKLNKMIMDFQPTKSQMYDIHIKLKKQYVEKKSYWERARENNSALTDEYINRDIIKELSERYQWRYDDMVKDNISDYFNNNEKDLFDIDDYDFELSIDVEFDIDNNYYDDKGNPTE